MRIVITGHRLEKLRNYDIPWIQSAIDKTLIEIHNTQSNLLAYSGMAGGVDLYFCKSCMLIGIPFIACIPFEDQESTMEENERLLRKQLLASAKEIKQVKNSWMVEHCDIGITCFDGNKGGTHNVFQQFIENRKNFYWINPVGKVTWKCFI